jgi:integrase
VQIGIISDMNSKAVTLMIRYKDAPGKWRRSPAARGSNGRVRPGYALVHGKSMPVQNGTYDLRHTVNRKTVYTPAGKRAAVADAKRVQLENTKSIVAQAAGNPDIEIVEKVDRATLQETASAYIKDADGRKANEAANKARLVTVEFMSLMRKRQKFHVDQIVRDDFFVYHAALRARGCGARTVANGHARLASWLRFGGIDKERIPPTPKYEVKLPTIYTSDQTRGMLAAADPYMRICVLLGLKCGLRDQELMHLEFRDLNWEDKTLRVQAKEEWGFLPKAWEQRDIPIPEDLMEELHQWENTRKGQTIVLGTRNRKPNTKLLRTLKRMVHRSGLHCGRCSGCREQQECQEYTLHRFRRTYLTTLLRSGIDLRTVQAYAGHKDISSTMRYLAPASGPEAHAKLNAVKW